MRRTFGLLRLSNQHLRDYLKRLPAFEDGEAQKGVLDLVLHHPYLGPALEFLHQWPDELVRADEKVLGVVAEALEAEQPLAATLCLRALIEAIVEQACSNRYRHAVRHLATWPPGHLATWPPGHLASCLPPGRRGRGLGCDPRSQHLCHGSFARLWPPHGFPNQAGFRQPAAR